MQIMKFLNSNPHAHYAGFSVLIGGLIIAIFVSVKPPASSTATPPQISPTAFTANSILGDSAAFQNYAGSSTCADCHKDQHAQWSASHHGRAERVPAKIDDERAFNPPRTFQHGTQHTDISQHAEKWRIAALGPDKRNEPLAIERVIGDDPLRQFLVAFPSGRFQALEAAYDPKRNDWFNVYGNDDRQPGEWGHWTGRGMNWNSMCASCHNARLRKNYSETSDSYATKMAEASVSCESCHGPMKAHVQWRQTNPITKISDPTVTKLSPEQSFETCAQCHSRRMELTGDFVPGDSFDDHFALSIVDNSELFHPDGQVREEDYEYSAFLGSRMHKAGVRCINCHDPHTAKVRLPGNAMCLTCHAAGAANATRPNTPMINPAAHSFHKVDPLYFNSSGDLLALSKRDPDTVAKSGGECINCHMPQTTYMQRHRRHDHGFTTPDPVMTQRFGIPNACNRCHADKDAGWAVTWTEKWYGEKMNRPSRKRTATLAGARKGDPGAQADLLVLLAQDDAPYWSASAARLLERWAAEPDVTAALVTAAQAPAALVRMNAVQTLAPLAGSSAVVDNALVRSLDDPALSTRFAAAWALRATIDPQSRAGRELTAILNFGADQPTGQMQKGAYFGARNDAPNALLHYQKAVAWDPNSAAFRHDYAVLLSALNRPKEAAEQLESACKLEPHDAEFRYKLALAWNELSDLPKAIAALRETVRLDPGHARAWYNLGLALNLGNQKDDAVQALLKAESADPRDPRNPYACATILAQLNRHEEAREAASRALQKQPDYAPALELLSTLKR